MSIRSLTAVVGLALALAAFAGPAAALEIRNASTDKLLFDPTAGEQVDIRFQLSRSAAVRVQIWDARERLVRELDGGASLDAGSHAIAWDGQDLRGRTVPPEAYHYTIVATAPDGTSVEHDLTDLTGGELMRLEDIRWEVDEGRLHYILPKPGRVSARIGLQNRGPLLRTVLDWAPRPAGRRSEPWDGMDQSGILDVRDHPKLRLDVGGIALPDNTILVGPTAQEVVFIEDLAAEPVREPKKKRVRRRNWAMQRAEDRRDVEIGLTLPSTLERNADGLPIVRNRIVVELDVADPTERARMLAERSEVAFFIDGQYVFENEVGYLPASWIWDPKGANPGVHYITGNLLGYEGHVGTATVAVWVEEGQ